MKILFAPFALATALLFSGVSAGAAEHDPDALRSVIRTQENIRDRTAGISARYQPLIDELRRLGTSSDDIELLRSTIHALKNLSAEEMDQIAVALGNALAAPGSARYQEELANALSGQREISGKLRSLLLRIQQRQQEQSLGNEASRIAEQLAVNLHRTELLADKDKPEKSAATVAEAEQRALEASVKEIAHAIKSLAAESETKKSAAFEALASEESLEKLMEAAEKATGALKGGDFEKAAREQKILQDELAKLASLSSLDSGTQAVAANLLRDIEAAIADQKSIRSQTQSSAPLAKVLERQNALTIRAETFRSPVESAHAGAGYQVRQAIVAMRAGGLALDRNQRPDALQQQDAALNALEAARVYLSDQIEALDAAEADSPSTPREQSEQAENFLREAKEVLGLQQKILASEQGTPGGPSSTLRQRLDRQHSLISRAVALQVGTRTVAPNAAESFGRAAVRMMDVFAEDTDTATARVNRTRSAENVINNLETAIQILAGAVEELKETQSEKQAALAVDEAQSALENAEEAINEALALEDEESTGEAENEEAQAAKKEALENALKTAAEQLTEGGEALKSLTQKEIAGLEPEAKAALSEAFNAMKEAAQNLKSEETSKAKEGVEKAKDALKKAASKLPPPPTNPNQDPNQKGPSESEASESEEGQEGTGGDQEGEGGENPNTRDGDGELVRGLQADLSKTDQLLIDAARSTPPPAAYSTEVDRYFENLARQSED